MRFLIILAAFLAAVSSVSSIYCDADLEEWDRFDKEILTCYVLYYDYFHDPDTIITYGAETEIEGFSVYDRTTKFIPKNINEKYPNLLVVRFKECSLDHVGENSFRGLEKLQSIYLSNNNIRTIDDHAFKDNTNVTFIDLSTNKIKHVKPLWFEHMHHLKTIYLDNNSIRFIAPDAFTGIPSIENINLSENYISYLDPKTFENLTNLKNFTISDNDLEALDKDLFKTNVNLHRVVFDFNNIRVIDPEMFESNENLFKVDLIGNSCVNENFDNGKFEDMKKQLKERCSDENIRQLEKEKNEQLKSLAETCKVF